MPEEIVERSTDEGYERKRIVEQPASTRHIIVTRVGQLIWLLAGVLVVLIGLRVLLKLIAANPSNAFASFVYGVTEVFLQPFFGLTSTPATQSGVVFEISSVIAMIVYGLGAFALVRLIVILFDDETGGSRKVQIQRRKRSS